MYSNVFIIYEARWHSGSTTFETNSSHCRVTRQGLPRVLHGSSTTSFQTSRYALTAMLNSNAGYKGVDGQAGTSGTSSMGKDSSFVRRGGTGGQPGECNTEGGNWNGGVGAGWLSQGCARKRGENGEKGGSRLQGWVGGRAGGMNSGNNGGPPPGAVGGFGGGGGGSEDNGASGGGGGYSGGGSGTREWQAGGGGGSYCSGSSCSGATGGNLKDDGFVRIIGLLN